jgi:hypothetical protein
VIANFSKTLSKAERIYCVTRRELLAIVKTLEHFHKYLYGQQFHLRTDHSALICLLNFEKLEGQKARWISVYRSITSRQNTGNVGSTKTLIHSLGGLAQRDAPTARKSSERAKS